VLKSTDLSTFIFLRGLFRNINFNLFYFSINVLPVQLLKRRLKDQGINQLFYLNSIRFRYVNPETMGPNRGNNLRRYYIHYPKNTLL